MQTLAALYLQSPFWIWMGAGAIFVALELATGSGKLIWPALAAAALAVIDLTGARLGIDVELALFLVFSIVAVALAFWVDRRRARPPSEAAPVQRPAAKPAESPSADPARTARLIGRIGRTTGAFANGVGRVWLDGTEWSAELEGGEEQLPSEAPVRVLGVSGGVRLRVEGLGAG